ncbi:hypothetical protein QQP08_004378, partial [Theobroma cacao]
KESHSITHKPTTYVVEFGFVQVQRCSIPKIGRSLVERGKEENRNPAIGFELEKQHASNCNFILMLNQYVALASERIAEKVMKLLQMGS